MSLKKLLVFTDFTLASGVAAKHCYQLASLAKAVIVSLHTITDEEDLEWAEKKSADQMMKLENYESNIHYTPLAFSQNLFQGMNTWLEKNKVDVAFMATHGKKDLQFITGSKALKLIFNSEVPFVVTQQHTFLRPYHHILLPIFSNQSGMKFPVEFLKSVAQLFSAKITLLTPATASTSEQEALNITITSISKSLQADNIVIEVKQSEQPEKKLGNSVMSFAEELNVDLVAVLVGAKHHREEAEKAKKFYQSVITNEQGVPVLCL